MILTGFYDTFSYFRKFGLNIAYYLEPSEIIFSLSTLFYLLVSLGIYSAIGALVREHSDGRSYIDFVLATIHGAPDEKKKIVKEQILRRRVRVTCLLVPLLIGIVVLLLWNASYLTITEKDLIFIWIQLLTIYWVCFQTWFVFKEVNSIDFGAEVLSVSTEVLQQSAKNQRLHLAWLFLSFFLLLQVRNGIIYRNVMEGHPSREITFQHSGDTIKSTPSTPYIGSSKEYIFLYDTANKSVIIYPEREVSISTIKELRIGL